MPSTRTRTSILTTLLLALIAGGCAGSGDPAAATDAEIAFLSGMVPHHAQAVEMAALVADRTAHPEELNPLAQDIIATQQEEIATMEGLLEGAGADPADAAHDMDGMDHGDQADAPMEEEMSGMMSADDLTALAAADGEAFDGMFLQMMIAHHEGAIDAAEQVIEGEGGDPDVTALAEDIVTAQEAEITQMRSWQEDWQG